MHMKRNLEELLLDKFDIYKNLYAANSNIWGASLMEIQI